MFLNCERLSINTWRLNCNGCGVEMDTIETAELTGIMMAGKGAFCMDCDTQGADHISPVLWQDETPYLLIADGTMLGCDWPTTMQSLTKTCNFLRQELYKAVNPHTLILEEDFSASYPGGEDVPL